MSDFSSLSDSYNDLNKAISNLSARGNQISGTADMEAGDTKGSSLWTDGSSSRPAYKDGSGLIRLLATKADIDDIKSKLNNK